MNCLFCGKPYRGIRSTRKYCSDTCKQYAYLNRLRTGNKDLKAETNLLEPNGYNSDSDFVMSRLLFLLDNIIFMSTQNAIEHSRIRNLIGLLNITISSEHYKRIEFSFPYSDIIKEIHEKLAVLEFETSNTTMGRRLILTENKLRLFSDLVCEIERNTVRKTYTELMQK